VGQEHRFVFEQAFIDRAEFLDVEGGVVDADGLAIFGVLVEAEGAQAAEQDVVAQHGACQRANGGGLNRSPASGARPSL
jgi:hypothetical protein